GIVYRVLVHPMGQAITYLVENFNWSYGWAVIAMTVIVRIIILPLGISQSKKTMIQSEKMQALKPQVEAAQQKLKAATTREEQMAAQAEMQQVYRENGLSMTGGIGCLPLLIQMPIFSALYFTARYTEGIRESSFYGIDLGSPSMVLVVIAGVAYLLQGYISTIGIPEEQKKTMRTMLIVSPAMIVFMS
ncbi:TPA: membrane protein insertase YidC, partial [Enterococcus faecium]|nr:membrane protein insertase YidC [Enterococcus faecium]